MRVAIFSHVDYEFMFETYASFFEAMKRRPDDRVVGMALFPNILSRHRGIHIYLYYLRVLGPLEFARLLVKSVLSRLAIVLHRLSGRYPAITYAGLCRHHGISLEHFSNPNSPAAIDWIRRNEIDVIFIFVGYILKRPVLDAPRVCVLNKHSALLPGFRGLLPVFWAKKEGRPVGVTIYKVNEKIDEGEILVQDAFDFPGLSVFDHYKRIYDHGPVWMIECLDILAGKVPPRTYLHDLPAAYFGLPTRKDVRAFQARGNRFA
jgi:methionyl-tRNA formyltransferase